MRNQQIREQIEVVTLEVEQQQRNLVKEKDRILKEIAAVLHEKGKHDLLLQLEQTQYFLDDAMYIAIFKAALEEKFPQELECEQDRHLCIVSR